MALKTMPIARRQLTFLTVLGHHPAHYNPRMQPDPSTLHPISLNTAAVLTGRSMRTWQRRIEEGLVPRLGDARALVPFEAIQPSLAVVLSPADVDMLVRADQGDAAAQADIGALLAQVALNEAKADKASRPSATGGGSILAAMHFLTQAADQGEADAMHWLGMLHAAGLGKGDGNALALMWIAKAAAHGHVIAQQQLAALMP